MNRKDRIEGLKLNYEQFIDGCNALEEEGLWNVEENGEMEAWVADDILCVIIRLVAADGKFTQEEVDFINDAFGDTSLGFDYSIDELKEVRKNCLEKIDTLFEEGIPETVKMLSDLDEDAAIRYRELLLQVCRLVSESDDEIAVGEKKEVMRLMELLNK